ncbi:MAG: YafY family protein [Sneathiella sp.]
MRLIRLFKILDHLRSLRRPVSAEALSVRFEVSMRTIYRDMSTLQELGAPIRGEGGIGYQIDAGFFLPPLHFDVDELDAIAFGMHMVAAKSDPFLSEAAKSAAAKIGAVLPPDQQAKFLDTPFRAHSKEHSNNPSALGRLPLLRSALRLKQKIAVRYCSLDNEISNRILHPLGITTFDSVWLLTAWCESKEDFRNFRVDKLEEVKILDKHFHPTPGRGFEDYMRTL